MRIFTFHLVETPLHACSGLGMGIPVGGGGEGGISTRNFSCTTYFQEVPGLHCSHARNSWIALLTSKRFQYCAANFWEVPGLHCLLSIGSYIELFLSRWLQDCTDCTSRSFQYCTVYC